MRPAVEMALAAAGDLLLGASCLACGQPWWGVCADCRAVLAARSTCYPTRPDPCPGGFPVTVTSSPYDELLASLITAHKDRQALTLTPFLAARLAASVDSLLLMTSVSNITRVVIAPVPSSSAVVRERGFDASMAMAKHAARLLRRRHNRPVRAVRLLRQRRSVRDQAGLTAAERQVNLSGSLSRTRAAASMSDLVVVVDDVVTTGSSVTEAARTLASGGVRVLGAATVAATVRRGRVGRPGAAFGVDDVSGD
jgi:predicted amidophosphoribosyltransferase